MEFRYEKITNQLFPIIFPFCVLSKVEFDREYIFNSIQIDYYLHQKHINSTRLVVHEEIDCSRLLALPVVMRAFEIREKGQMNFVISLYKEQELVAKVSPSRPFVIDIVETS